MEPETLMEAVKYFADLEICDLYMRRIKWPDGRVACPFCGSERIGEIKSRHLLRCKDCRRDISLRIGTIFGDSPLPLGCWFAAILCVANNTGISSTALGAALGISQKSAWRMLRTIYTAIVCAG